MIDTSRIFVEKSRSLLTSEYMPKIERCLERLSDEDLWWRPNDGSNSIGNLLLHLHGNVTQWIIGGVGGRPYQRDRQQEFDERTPLPRAELLEKLRAVIAEANTILASLDAEALAARRQIQAYDTTVLEAIYHVVEHFSMHTGQIILITKARTGGDFRLWRQATAATR